MARASRDWSRARRWTAAEAGAALAAMEASGLSMARFAERQGVDVQRLYWWRRRLSGTATLTRTGGFVELPQLTAPCGDSAPFEVRLRSGHTVLVPVSFDVDALRKLIAALETLAC